MSAAGGKLIRYVGWGGRERYIAADFRLGWGVMRGTERFGLRRIIWDIAYGYVSGFRLRDIAYFILTRDLSPRLWHRTFLRENPGGILLDSQGNPWARGGCRPGCRPCLTRLGQGGDQ